MFRDNLERILKEKGVSQIELSELIGTSRPATVSDWLTAHKEPSLRYVYKICEVLHVTPNDLLGYSQQTLADYSTDELLAEIRRRTITK